MIIDRKAILGALTGIGILILQATLAFTGVWPR